MTIAPHTGGYMGIRIASTANTFTAAANTHSFLSNTSGTAMMTILGSGNVGIGTTSPQTPLHVFSNVGIALSNNSTVVYTGSGTLGYGFGGGVGAGTQFQFRILSQTVNRDNGAGPNFDYGAQGDLVFQRKTNNLFGGGVNDQTYTEVMRIGGATGYVGIGMTNPGYLVDVAGDVNSTGSFRINTILQPKVYHYNSFNGVTSFDAGNFDLVNFNNVEIRVIPAFNTTNSGALQIQALDTAGTVYGAAEAGYVVWQGNRSTAFAYGGSATVFGNTEIITNGVGPYICIVRITSINAYTGSQRFHVQWTSTGCWAGTGAATDTGQCFFATTNIQLNRIRFNLTAGTMTGKYSIVHYL